MVKRRIVLLCLAMCPLLLNCSGKTNTLQILHANVNCSDFEQSLSFYQMLGFVPLLEDDIVVSSEEEAAGLRMPLYELHASTMVLKDGFMMDLIRWKDPYDGSAPYAFINHLGLSSISLKTTNLDADVMTLRDQGVEFFSDPVTIDRPVENSRLVCFRDPDGIMIELIQLGDAVGGVPNRAGTYITGALRTNVNCSDLEASRRFYEMLGFVTQSEVEEVGSPALAEAVGLPSYHVRASTMTLPLGHSLNLTKWEEPYDSDPPYAALNHRGIARVAILTLTLDSDMALLEDQGIVFYSRPVRPAGPYGFLRFACVEDPDGAVLEMVQLF